jgi:secreted trypsin-like serine protease
MVLLCGIVAVAGTPASAIVGGRDATQVYPGMASLTIARPDGRTAWCGATLIHPQWLLTVDRTNGRHAEPVAAWVVGDR